MSWETALINFSHTLIPSQEYVTNGNLALQKVVEKLKTQQTLYRIDRVCLGGSIGKHTSLEDSDFDCILIVNNIGPPYEKVLKYFEDILKQSMTSVKISKLTRTNFSLQFELDGKYYVDLLVAGNYVSNQGRVGLSGIEITREQQSKVLDKISDEPGRYYEYSSSLAASQIEFMKKEDSMTHSLVRLCKYWFKTLAIGKYRSGVKAAIELIAVCAAQSRSVQRSHNSILKAFTTFLHLLENINSLRIVFQPTGQMYRRVQKKLRNPNSCLGRTMPEKIKSKSHFILDPANPFNDLSEDILPELANHIKRFATFTKTNLNSRQLIPPINMDFKSFFEVCARADQTVSSVKKSRKSRKIRIY